MAKKKVGKKTAKAVDKYEKMYPVDDDGYDGVTWAKMVSLIKPDKPKRPLKKKQ